MKNSKLLIVLLWMFMGFNQKLFPQDMQHNTYCNPINIDYTYMIFNADKGISYRSGADPSVVEFRGEYYMFVTRSMGYWHSRNLNTWEFIKPEKWYFKGSNAPAARNYKDSLLYVAGDPSGAMNILYTDKPKKGNWKAEPLILRNLQDPDLFFDDDDQAYIYWGSSNKFPIRAKKLNRKKQFSPDKKTDSLFNLNEEKHGWERFGENNSNTELNGYIEGPWMTKHNEKYYLQYAAPGTEFNVYGDGVYIGDSPTGPFHYAPNNPFSFKPGGFINGAGHGSTVLGPGNQYWHFSTMAVNVNMNWERRIGLFPTFFDKDGLMHSDTYFGDYPHFAPGIREKKGRFTGWMLLSYKKPVETSTALENFSGKNMVDENIKSFWVAKENNAKQWVKIDLKNPSKVYAIQINFNDYKSDLYGKPSDLHHRYEIEGSLNGNKWETLVDRRKSYEDTPNDYVELSNPQKVRYIRYTNISIPTKNLSISGLRIFGKGNGKKPKKVGQFKVRRQKDKRNATISWGKQNKIQGYNVLWGIAPDKLYHSWMVYEKNELKMRNLNRDQTYYFSIEAFNENGIGQRTKPIKID